MRRKGTRSCAQRRAWQNKKQTKVGMVFLRVPTNTLTHNPGNPAGQGFSQVWCQNDGGDYPCTRPTLYYKVANVLIQSPDFQLNTTIMVVKCWRRHMFAPSFGYQHMLNDGASFMQIYTSRKLRKRKSAFFI